METVNLEKIYNEIKKMKEAMITREQLNTFIETIEILSNQETMKQIVNSEADIDADNFREISSVYEF